MNFTSAMEFITIFKKIIWTLNRLRNQFTEMFVAFYFVGVIGYPCTLVINSYVWYSVF